MMDAFGHHCLYFEENDAFDTYNSLIPFCIRSETQIKSNDESKLCYGDGERITFKELKSINVSIADLFKWNAAIEIIDLYEKYLLSPNLINDNQFYCNCSFLSQFGKFCEYEFNSIDFNDDKRSFTMLLREKGYLLSDEIKNEYVTYYIGIQCQTNLLYLDWRQICNGIVDCDSGEDEPEELCLQMESNQCNAETEFRCKNGLCIPISFRYDVYADCQDRSDKGEIYQSDSKIYLLLTCSLLRNFECDENNYGWKQFSCGDGQFISYSDLTSRIDIYGKTCENKRHFKYLTKLFNSNNKNKCWKSMICLTGFDYLYSNLTCLNETIENNIKEYCPNQFYFPSNSVVYSFVYFLYEKLNRTNWFNYTGPNYICYNKQYCGTIQPTILKNNLTCFYVNQTLFSWNNFSEYIIYLFSSCYSNISTSVVINNEFLYKCNLSNTFISIYRLKDKTNDCFFNEDEYSNIDLCSFNTNDQFKCLTNENECIRQPLLNDKQYDCSDGSDEYIQFSLDYCEQFSCTFHWKQARELPRIYRFEELCDNIVNRHLFSIGSNETDETDCEYWPFTCNSPFTRCNRIWNCENGLDEINCQVKSFDDDIRNSFNCNKNEIYCIQLINNDINMSCISLNRIGDGIIDCIGGTDERLTNNCTKIYPIDYEKRFYCMNSSVCIRPDQVCDQIINCPFQDDERICPWLFKSNSSKFFCKNSSLVPLNRCVTSTKHDLNCQLKEHLWFCDLALKGIRNPPMISMISFELYPKNNQKIRSLSFERIDSKNLALSLINRNIDIWLLCNEGYPIESNNKFYCLCSPSYYGDYCQYQSERLTLIIKFELQDDIDPLTVFRLIIYLMNDNNVIISSDEIIYNHPLDEDVQLRKFFVYLIDERMTNLSLYQRSKSKFVRIDSYIIKETNVQYISSWFFNVSFPFLPVNRLAVLLLLKDESFKMSKCKKRCGSHGKCMYYLNSNETEYCWCDQSWKGEKCHQKSSSNLCNKTSCSPNSQCAILNDEKNEFKCICPLGKSGNQCYIKYNSCHNVFCQNNGTCLQLDQRNFDYTCICKDNYRGRHCEVPKKISSISIPGNISHLSSIPVIIIIFDGFASNTFDGGDRLIYKNIFLPDTLKMYGPVKFGFVRMFHNISRNFYYLIAVQSFTTEVNTSVISQNLCSNVSQLFNQTILSEYSYLKRLKFYHLPCQQNKDLRCFYDEYRMCLCTKDHFSDCYLFNHEYNDCNYCKNDGLCLRQNPGKEQWNFACLCPKCSFGLRCQFVSGNYFITLDMLIGNEIKKDISFNQQSFIIYLTLSILILILLISFILNIITIIIFSNKKLRQVGCDLYLLYLTIISQIGLILLFLRFLYMIIVQIYVIENDLFIEISCIFLEYSLRLIPSLFDWLTVCISIERTYTIIKDIQFTKSLALKTLKLSRWIILFVFLLNILTTFHRPFYLILVDDNARTRYNRKSGHPWCVLDFESTHWNIYEKCINIIHLVLPLILNLLSFILFLLRKIKSESITTIRKAESSKFVILKEQLRKYKPLLIGPMIIIILEIPRFVLTFTLSCFQYPWQRYLYLTGYLISFLPLTGILFIYIIPSPKYKEQFRIIMKKTFLRSFFRNE